MPQGHRKVPFSTKQKKVQLQQKREKKRQAAKGTEEENDDTHGGHTFFTESTENEDGVQSREAKVYDSLRSEKLAAGRNTEKSAATRSSRPYDPNRYKLKFHRDSREEVEKRKQFAATAIHRASEEALEVDVDEVFMPGTELDIPKRPKWDFNMSKLELDARENRYFREYVMAVEKKFSSEELSFFELNLETWRQLWRVLEMADIVFIVVDIRFPALLISPALYDYVTGELKRDVVIVLNKIDMAPPPLVVAWKHYVKKRFPLVRVVCFTSFPTSSILEKEPSKRINITKQRGRLRMAAEGAARILDVCEQIVGDRVDLSSWKEKIREEIRGSALSDAASAAPSISIEKFENHFENYERFKDGILTIGFIGQPNVGKSSLINGLVGKKVVSVSRTPGHTKHFQTIFLTGNVRLCDCPGLVFPSKVPRGLQVLSGSFPIAQLQEPFSAVRFLAEHIQLIELLKIRHPNGDDPTAKPSELEWSPIDICDAWAQKRGFMTTRGARTDNYRAANNILHMALDGRLCICIRPKGYSNEKVKWENHPELEEVRKIIIRQQELEVTEDGEPISSSSEEDEDDNESHHSEVKRESDEGEASESAEEEKGALSNQKQTAINKYSLVN